MLLWYYYYSRHTGFGADLGGGAGDGLQAPMAVVRLEGVGVQAARDAVARLGQLLRLDHGLAVALAPPAHQGAAAHAPMLPARKVEHVAGRAEGGGQAALREGRQGGAEAK